MSIAALRRVYMLKELEKRVLSWADPNIQKNFVVYPNNPMLPSFGIEREQNGFFYMSDDLVYYCDITNGKIDRVKKNFNIKEYECYKELCDYAQSSGKFRIRSPIHREEVILNNVRYEYVELKTPNSEYGQSLNESFFDENKSLNKESIQDYIDRLFELLESARPIAKKHKCELSGGLIEPSNLYKDSKGYFWSNIDNWPWNISESALRAFSLDQINAMLFVAHNNSVIDEQQGYDLLNYARNKWTTI